MEDSSDIHRKPRDDANVAPTTKAAENYEGSMLMSNQDNSSRAAACFSMQANALLRTNFILQKRHAKTNTCILSFPIILCLIMLLIQNIVNNEYNKPKYKCGCKCDNINGDASCKCGIQYSTPRQAFICANPRPLEWPPLMQVPRPSHRAVSRSSFSSLPDASCRKKKTCPSTVLVTGGNKSFATNVANNFFPPSSSMDPKIFSSAKHINILSALINTTLGTDTPTAEVLFVEPAFRTERPLYYIQSRCTSTSKKPIQIPMPNSSQNATIVLHEENSKSSMPNKIVINLAIYVEYAQVTQCLEGSHVWRDTSSVINAELYNGYRQANRDRSINEIMAAYDFLNSSSRNFNLNIWYNSTYDNEKMHRPPALLRVGRSVNVASNAYLQYLNGSSMKIFFNFTKEMPKPATQLLLEFSSLLGGLFFTWIIELLFPVFLTYLVYEKEKKLKVMMKMHGLGDGPYWAISYCYFLFLSSIYVLLLVIFGSLIKLKFFTSNDYSILFVFFFAFVNLQIVLAFLASTVFSNVKTAQGFSYIYVFTSGLVSEFLLATFVQDLTFPRHWVIIMELVPGFSLYRGLYEFGMYSFIGGYMGTPGMSWKDLGDEDNGMKEALIIIIVEWCVLLPLAYYLDQLTSLGSRIRKNPLPFLQRRKKKVAESSSHIFQRQGSKVIVDIDKLDVVQEREVVEKLLLEPSVDCAIVSDNLRKVYNGYDGNPDKLAVQGLSLAVPRGECFGILGPNGAGKTSFIGMMAGLLSPTSGKAYVHGYSIESDMNKIYTSMGVCPQHDMLWETLTGREHLQFYGRLKNLKGSALLQAVEESLRSVNLFFGGAADKLVRKYSGGMKRRLSVAISLIGDPKVVYMDEPSTGLDPASRNNLWHVIKHAKKNRAIILTTHSMEEAEALCDRIGIFVDGSMRCIGNPKQLKARYGGSYIVTITTSQDQEDEVESLVHNLSSKAIKIYRMSGTQKFEIPKQEIKIAEVFGAVEDAKERLTIQAWGLADTTLEDVFIKVADGVDLSNT